MIPLRILKFCGNLVPKGQKCLKQDHFPARGDLYGSRSWLWKASKLTGWHPLPIMHRSLRLDPLLWEACRVIYISTAVELKKETRARVSKTYEHQERTPGLSSPASQRACAVDGLT